MHFKLPYSPWSNKTQNTLFPAYSLNGITSGKC